MFQRLGLKPETVRAYTPTICNGIPCGIETRDALVGADFNHYQVGIDIRIRGDGTYSFETWTIWKGHHVMNNRTIVDSEGKLVAGHVVKLNCFDLGWITLDQAWMDEFLHELETSLKEGKRVWEKVE